MTPKLKTIFILGAGSSVEYGYPLGPKLREEIISLESHLNSLDTQMFCDLLSNGQTRYVAEDIKYIINTFVDTFRGSGKGTIDEFIRRQSPVIREVARYAVAYILLKSESANGLLLNGNSWCHKLWNRLTDDNDFTLYQLEPNYGFITFNYDISLEHLFNSFIKNTFRNITQNEIQTYFTKMPIIHIHGKADRVESLQSEPKYGEKYGLEGMRFIDIWNASRGIQFMTEVNESSSINVAKHLLAISDNIIFLGFGFHPENYRKLDWIVSGKRPSARQSGGEELFSDSVFMTRKNVLATTIDMNDDERGKITTEPIFKNIYLDTHCSTIAEFLDMYNSQIF